MKHNRLHKTISKLFEGLTGNWVRIRSCGRVQRIVFKFAFLLLLSVFPAVTSSASTDIKKEEAVKAFIDLEYDSSGNADDGLNEEKPGPAEVLVVIDPGHGGDELGTCHGGMYEKNVNLDISLRMWKLLGSKGIKTAMTREKDIYMGLKERAEFANNLDATLFISVHNNNMPGQPDYRGTETLYTPPQKPVFSTMDGAKLAAIVQKELINTLKTYDNGIIHRPNLAVIRRTKMPAVIAEIAYMSNASDRVRLAAPEFRQKAAQALANAVVKALDAMGAYREENTNKLMINRD